MALASGASRRTLAAEEAAVEHWLTVEVLDADTPASGWLRSWHDSLAETAVSSGAVYWDDHEHQWGVVLEFAFDDEAARDRFRQHPAVRAALDAVPDVVNGVLVYPHRGGGSGSRVPRRPRPVLGSGAVALPEPEAFDEFGLFCDRVATAVTLAAENLTPAIAA
jgi:hypothetical protein